MTVRENRIIRADGRSGIYGVVEKSDFAVIAAAELREGTGLSAGSMVHAGRLFEAYGYATRACDIFLATSLVQGRAEREAEEAGMIAEGAIKDAATVAAFGLLRLKKLI
jgi:ADP-ribose pyrophosphatase